MTEQTTAVYQTDFPRLVHRGKVRDLYDLGDRLMVVASDRISAFDVVMAQPVPGKGAILTRMSRFWFETLPAAAPHHLDYVVSADRVPAGYEPWADQLRDRAMVCRKAQVVPVECVVRGYIVGGGWKEYQETGCVSGIALPAGLRLAEQLPEPIFTPSTKATSGHDEPISFERACAQTQRFLDNLGGGDGMELMEHIRRRSLDIYTQAAAYARKRGIILADTKFEFGLCNGKLLLVDEVLTPDSSRYWPTESWRPGENPASFDKQFLRDYLNSLDWNKQPPPPPIPDDIIERTRRRYEEACALLLG